MDHGVLHLERLEHLLDAVVLAGHHDDVALLDLVEGARPLGRIAPDLLARDGRGGLVGALALVLVHEVSFRVAVSAGDASRPAPQRACRRRARSRASAMRQLGLSGRAPRPPAAPLGAADVEEGGVDGAAAVRQHRAQHAVALEAHVPAEAGALERSALQRRRSARGTPRPRAGRRACRRAPAPRRRSCAAASRAARRTAAPGHEVEPDDPRAVQHQHAALAVDAAGRRRAAGRGRASSPRTRRAWRPCGECVPCLRVQRRDLGPHGALVGVHGGAAAQAACVLLLHGEADAALRHDLALRELPRGVAPAALLGAAHRDHEACCACR